MSAETKKYPYPFKIIPNTALWLTISVLVVVLGLVKMGYNYGTKGHVLDFGIDYTGGASYVFKFDKLPGKGPSEVIHAIREPLTNQAGIKHVAIQVFTRGNQVQVRTTTGSEKNDVAGASKRADQEAQKILSILQQKFGKVEKVQQELVGPVIGEYLRNQGILAVLIGCTMILFYVWIRYNIGGLGGGYLFGLCCVIALVHDVLVMLCAYAFTGHDIDTTFIASVLTVVGFSVQDTVIIFDRIRENLRKLDPVQRRDPDQLAEVIEASLWQTMTRSVVTVCSCLLPLACLFTIGGVSIRNFAFAMFVGMLSGGYSSIFNAAPLLMLFNRRALAKRALVEPLVITARSQRPRTTAAPAAPKRTEPTAAAPSSGATTPALPATTGEATDAQGAGVSATKKKGGKGSSNKRRY